MFLIVFLSILNDALTRQQAWHAFEKAAKNVQRDSYCLELLRHARMFSTAPPEEHEGWEIGIMAASAQGNERGVIVFGKELYNWAQKNGYSAVAALLASSFSFAL